MRWARFVSRIQRMSLRRLRMRGFIMARRARRAIRVRRKRGLIGERNEVVIRARMRAFVGSRTRRRTRIGVQTVLSVFGDFEKPRR